MEVERERLRVAVAEDVALAHAAAERGNYVEAARILTSRREAVAGADAASKALAAELGELGRHMRRTSGSTGERATRACSPA